MKLRLAALVFGELALASGGCSHPGPAAGRDAMRETASLIPVESFSDWDSEPETEKVKWEPASFYANRLRGDHLEATVEYVDRCDGGPVRVFAGGFKEKYPVYVSFTARHQSKSGCSGRVRRTVLVDLTALKTRYRHAYGGDHGAIDIGLPPFEFYQF